jgi:hypothetical protein
MSLVTLLLIAVAVAVVLGLLFWKILSPKSFKERKEFIDLFAKILGGATVVLTLFFTWQEMKDNQEHFQKTLDISTQTLAESQNRQFAERYSKANEQLGNTSLKVRIGGIYALGRLASDAPDYYWPVMQVLTSYVRENYPWKEGGEIRAQGSAPTDIQAVFDVIGWRKMKYGSGEDQRLDLHGTNLSGLILKDREDLNGKQRDGAHLEGAQLFDANLDNSNLRGIHLEGAILKGTSLKRAHLAGAYFSDDSDLANTDLEGANLGGATIPPAVLKVSFNWESISSPPESLRAEWEAKKKAK